MFLCFQFKEVRDTYVQTIEKRIHFCLFKADCLQEVLLKRLGWYFIHWIFWFSVLHSSAHRHQLHTILMGKNYVNLSHLLVITPLPASQASGMGMPFLLRRSFPFRYRNQTLDQEGTNQGIQLILLELRGCRGGNFFMKNKLVRKHKSAATAYQ